jgi:hypothetical protein
MNSPMNNLMTFLFQRSNPALGSYIFNHSKNANEKVLPKIKWEVNIVAVLKVIYMFICLLLRYVSRERARDICCMYEYICLCVTTTPPISMNIHIYKASLE